VHEEAPTPSVQAVQAFLVKFKTAI
jgi:hypothetical protein